METVIIRRIGLAVLAVVLLTACVSGVGSHDEEDLTRQERTLLAYIPEALRPTCVTEYQWVSDCFWIACDARTIRVTEEYPGAIAGFFCSYEEDPAADPPGISVRVDYLRYPAATDLQEAFEDAWWGRRLEAGGCLVGKMAEYRYRVEGGSAGGLLCFYGYFPLRSEAHVVWTDDRALILADAMQYGGTGEPGELYSWWLALVGESVDLEARAPGGMVVGHHGGRSR